MTVEDRPSTHAPAAGPPDDVLEARRWSGPRVGWDEVIGHERPRRELAAHLALARQGAGAQGTTPVISVLLSGPHGTGKTLLAKALASQSDLPVYVISAGEDDAKAIGAVFEALAGVPAIVIVDEVDLAGRMRWAATSDDGVRRRGGALMAALDGLATRPGPVVVGLTAESSWSIDPGLRRRFAVLIELEAPDEPTREAMFSRFLGQVPNAGVLDIATAARRTPDSTGSDIRAMVASAYGLALADGLEAVDQVHLDEVLSRHRRSTPARPLGPDAVRHLAVHEASHAVAVYLTLGPAALGYVTLEPQARGNAHTTLDAAWVERHLLTTRTWRAQVLIAYAGPIGEELVLGVRTLGVEHDLTVATGHLRDALDEGLDPEIGLVAPSVLESRHTRLAREGRSLVWSAVLRTSRAVEAETWALLRPRRAVIERLAETLAAAGTLAGPRLIEAMEAAGLTPAAVAAAGQGTA
jgi:SpoVK/Ycf46/Vps4 family AAA+-type ATPase